MPKKPAGNLVAAVRTGDLALVKGLIQCGADLNYWDPSGTPLSLAAELGFEDIVQALLEAGTDVDAGRVYRLLTVAIEHDHPEIACLLIEGGSDVVKSLAKRLPEKPELFFWWD